MPITAVDKVKINKYLKEHSNSEICYLDLCDAIGKRGKVSDVEFLEYFTDYSVKQFREGSKISVKHMAKVMDVIESFLRWMAEEDSEIKEELLDKIRSFGELYDGYVTRTNIAFDETFYNEVIGVVLDKVNELYPTDTNSESVTKYITKIAELEDIIKKLEKEVVNSTNMYNASQKASDKKAEKIDDLCLQISDLQRDISGKDKEVNGLNGKILELNQKVNELEESLKLVQDENFSLVDYKQKYMDLSIKAQELRKVIREVNKQKKTEEKHTKMSSIMYEKMLADRVGIDNLLSAISKQGIETDRQEVVSVLSDMKRFLTVDSSFFSTSPTYKICTPNITEDGNFSIDVPFNCKHYDIMLISDIHIKEFDKNLLSKFDLLNDYCVKNGISLVLNLGDFYDGYIHSLDYEKAKKTYSVVEESISRIPKVDGIYHAILGGNHEKSMARYGFDPISFLTREREDFVNLGYTHSTISLGNPDTILGSFDIHHPDNYDMQIELTADGVDINSVNNYLQNIYSNQGRSREDSYIDIFGHTHKSHFNYPGSYCYLPPYAINYATHLRVYLDDDTDIKYMIFMPLHSNGQHLVKNDEIVYQKILRR